jgi:hypothetical protein
MDTNEIIKSNNFSCFLVNDFSYEHEQQAFKKLFNSLKEKYINAKNKFCLIVQPFISPHTPDLIIITNNNIAVAELKAGFGKIIGNENSAWYAEKLEINKARENPFQ